jgi:hypothetical protein
MKYHHRILILTAIITTSAATGAQEVYENVDRQGVVEFSDRPGPGAKEIDVKPNVVDVAPAKPIESSQPTPSTGASKAPAGRVRPEVIQQDTAGDYYDDYGKRRKIRQERRERTERGEQAVRQPIRKEAGRGSPHRGGHGR